MIEERETAKEEGTRSYQGGRRDKGGNEGEGSLREKKVFGQENKKNSLASFKATATPGLCDISQPIWVG